MSRPSSTSYASLSGKRRILLVDTYANKRDLRAKIMRKLGVEVDCAADITEARALWQADSYSLVLVDVRNDSVNVQEFCSEVRSAKPPQAVAFLVGKPDYLAGAPGADEVLVASKNNGHDAWGFQEASWRIAAVRTLNDPRPGRTPVEKKRPNWSWTDAVKQHSGTLAD